MSEYLRKNITRNEIACNCGCGFSSVSPAVLDVVQDARDYFNKPAARISSCRCKKWNKKKKGRKKSLHLPNKISKQSRAIDFVIEGVSINKLYAYLNKKYPNSLGIGKYKKFCHVDDRMKMAYRWAG